MFTLNDDQARHVANVRVWEAQRASVTDPWLKHFLTGEIRRERAKLAASIRQQLRERRGAQAHSIVS